MDKRGIFVYIPKRLQVPIAGAARKAQLTEQKWLLSLAEKEIERAAKKPGKARA